MKQLTRMVGLLLLVSLCGCETGRGLKKDLRQFGKDVGAGLSETGRALKKSVQ